ncbi:MAG: hypothetical protein OJF51_002689 [Nitrospira sp.]|nr:MAG: hypothetical protein OJF51_002689 [Nitrospira sp.]
MFAEGLDATTAAFQIGYESPSNSVESTAVCSARLLRDIAGLRTSP